MTAAQKKSAHTNTTALQCFRDLMMELKKLDPEFPIQYGICLAEIALDEGLSLTQLAERTELALSTVSRIVGALSQYRANGQPFGLVDLKVSKEERRRKELFLTHKGWSVLRSIGAVLDQNRSR